MEDEESTDLKDVAVSTKTDESGDDFIIGEENEPYLGISWFLLMLVLWGLKTLFPAQEYSLFWWFHWYIIFIVTGVTIFTLLKRYKYSKNQHPEEQFPVKHLPESE